MIKKSLIAYSLVGLVFLGACTQYANQTFEHESSKGNNGGAQFACSTESLADGTGIKIICCGDFIGVVFYKNCDGMCAVMKRLLLVLL